jgi:catechol 2,3-dioxygenase-like lactoylglutathione lyase family enzyme
MNEPLIRYPIVQYAYVVPNLEEGIRHWVEVMGAGPFFVSRSHLGRDLTYRGKPSTTRVHYAFGQAGPAQIQLIAHDEPGSSIYRDMYGDGEGGFHHVGVLVPAADMPAEIARFEAAGYPVASSLMSYVPVAYFDCRDRLDCFVELHGLNDDIEELFRTIREAHEGWDGVTDPIRTRNKSSSL